MSYTNLPPKSYRLEIMVSNRANALGRHKLEIDIEVLPKWHQTNLAIVIAVVGLCLLVYGLIRFRSRRLLLMQVELTRLVTEKTIDLKHAQARLMVSEKQAALGKLVRGVAHELNTPIGIMHTATSMIGTRLLSLPQAQNIQQVETAANQIRKANDLLEKNVRRVIGLLDNFKLVASDDSEKSFSRFKLGAHLGIIINQIDRGSMVIELDGDASLEIYSDKSIITYLISELVNNARQHAFVEGDSEQLLQICFWQDQAAAQQLRISVVDNGTGMPREFIAKCFDPFTAVKVGTVGLGLHIVFNHIKIRLNGHVECCSQEPDGTRFDISLPSIEQAMELPS